MESSSSSAASAPHSPATTMTSNSPDQDHDHDHQPTAQNSLDDIFGSSPPPNTIHDELTGQPAVTGAEPSELPSLRRQHVTAGYRDGISVSKGERVQDGFDAGFPVGAQLGMRAGTVLGILEGLVRGFEGRAGGGVVKKLPVRNKSAGSEGKGNGATEKEEDNVDARRKAKREEILKLYQRAVKDMAVQNVFAGLDSSLANPDVSDEKPETHLARQGDAAVSTWEERVRVAQWEANMEALEEKEKHDTATAEPEHS